MKGIELSKQFYMEAVAPLVQSKFSPYENRIAVGLVGHGSECFGFDDDTSKDHDHGTGLCLFVTKQDDEKIGFALMRAYDKIAREYGVKGVEREVENGFRGVFAIGDFYRRYTGTDARRPLGKIGFTPIRCTLPRRQTEKCFVTTWASFQKFATRFCTACPKTCV